MCKDRIEKAATIMKGVETAVWDKESKMLTVTHTSDVEVHAINQAIANARHDIEMHKATDEVYAAMPGCCKYRDENTEDTHDH